MSEPDQPTKDAEAWKCCGCGRVISDDFVKRCDCWTRVAFCGKEQKWLRAQPASGLADLSLVPNDIYVVSASTPDGVVYDAICCSVPMAIGPEVRYTRAEAAEDQLAARDAEVGRLREALFRAEHRELVSAACWHRSAELAANGNWQSLRLRLSEMTAEERHAKVVASMDAQRAARAALAAPVTENEG